MTAETKTSTELIDLNDERKKCANTAIAFGLRKK